MSKTVTFDTSIPIVAVTTWNDVIEVAGIGENTGTDATDDSIISDDTPSPGGDTTRRMELSNIMADICSEKLCKMIGITLCRQIQGEISRTEDLWNSVIVCWMIDGTWYCSIRKGLPDEKSPLWYAVSIREQNSMSRRWRQDGAENSQ